MIRNVPKTNHKTWLTLMTAVAAWTCFVTPPQAAAKEPHPILLIRPDQVDQYKVRVADIPEKYKTYGWTTDIPLAALIDYLRGRRCDEAVASVKTALASKDPGRVANAVLVYDVQYPFLTEVERTTLRQQFLASVEPIYQDAIHKRHWMYERRPLNNWTYGFGGMPLQNLLFIGLAFPDDPRSALYVAQGKKLLRWVLEGGPNNGTWNEKREEFDVYPTKIDMIDESIGAAPVYGLGGLNNLLLIMHVLDNVTDDRPFERFGRMMHSEGRWWTYNLGYKEKIHFFRNASCFASYMNSVGHGHYQPLSRFYFNNQEFLYLALRYNDPVLAWHHYANPGSIDSPDNRQFIENGLWKVKSFKDQRVSWNLWTFLSWGMVAPKSPEEAGWPLTEFWPNAGTFVIRKSWARNVRVARPGEKTGAIVGWGGPGGSKDRVFFGTVRYDADDHEVLGCSPFSGTGGPPVLFEHPALHNVLVVDGVAQKPFGNIRFNRLRHGTTRRLGPDTFLMDLSPQDRPDFLSEYAAPAGGRRLVDPQGALRPGERHSLDQGRRLDRRQEAAQAPFQLGQFRPGVDRRRDHQALGRLLPHRQVARFGLAAQVGSKYPSRSLRGIPGDEQERSSESGGRAIRQGARVLHLEVGLLGHRRPFGQDRLGRR